MKVLLLEDVAALGNAGSVVSVADGYARNYLLPRRLAKTVSEGSVKEVEQVRRSGERKREQLQSSARDLAGRLNALTLTFRARAGEKGKLYGSITTADLADAMQQQVGQEVDRRKIVSDALRQLGDHVVEVRLLADVTAHVKVVVEAEQTEPPAVVQA